MNKQQILTEVSKKFKLAGVIDVDEHDSIYTFPAWINEQLKQLHKEVFENKERIVYFITQDFYQKDSELGLKLKILQQYINRVDISNFFCLIVTNNKNINKELELLNLVSTDKISLPVMHVNDADYKAIKVEQTQKGSDKKYNYSSTDLLKMDMSELNDRENHLLTKSKSFCIYPWVHMHAYPTGEVYPCCAAERVEPIGYANTTTLKELWNAPNLKKLRIDMLEDNWNSYCTRCYEQENAGFFSMRNSANKHLGHHIKKIEQTNTDGSVDDFKMVYWDIRFSNLCNLRCRSCGYIFSSQWYNDQVKLMGTWAEDFKKKTKVLNYAGRTETDMWEQLEPHLDYVEQIYFAGGEPLLMEEHYRILDELDRRGMHDVRLVYNTNFTNTDLKGRSVFEYWKKFKNVGVGASLDGMGAHAEYIRKGTVWADIERNREEMIEICPQVDFYVSATMSIFNALHLPDFHRAWVERGFIRAQDFNVNILQDPAHYRIDIAHTEYKKKIQTKFEQHLDWLRPQDQLRRAIVGFESAITFLNTTDNKHLIELFWTKTDQLDSIRKENLLHTIPELSALK